MCLVFPQNVFTSCWKALTMDCNGPEHGSLSAIHTFSLCTINNVIVTCIPVYSRVVRDNTVPVRYPPKHKGIYCHQCGQEEEESLQIPIMQYVWVEVTCKQVSLGSYQHGWHQIPCHHHLLSEGNVQYSIFVHFTSRDKVHQLNDEGSQKTAPSIGQSEEVQGDPPDVAWGQLERYEGTCKRGRDRRNVWSFFLLRICDSQSSTTGKVNNCLGHLCRLFCANLIN